MIGGKCTARLSPVSLGLAFGITSALCTMLLAWSAYYWGMGSTYITQLSEFYPGLDATIKGMFFGGGWGFLGGFIYGVIFAWIYNLCLCCCACCCRSKSSSCCRTSEKCEHMDKKIDSIENK